MDKTVTITWNEESNSITTQWGGNVLPEDVVEMCEAAIKEATGRAWG